MPIQRSTTRGAGRSSTARDLVQDQRVDTVGLEGVGGGAVVVAVAHHQRTVGALHHDQVDAVRQVLGLLRVQPRAQRGQRTGSRHSRGSDAGRGRSSPPPAAASRGSARRIMCSLQQRDGAPGEGVGEEASRGRRRGRPRLRRRGSVPAVVATRAGSDRLDGAPRRKATPRSLLAARRPGAGSRRGSRRAIRAGCAARRARPRRAASAPAPRGRRRAGCGSPRPSGRRRIPR